MEESVFSGDSENIHRWLSWAGVVFGLIAAVILVYALTRKPGWLNSPAAHWTLLIGLFLLPSITMLLGNVVGFAAVKDSCGSCHTMDPWMADLKDPKSTTLAAKHFQNRWINEHACYTCHTGYGLSGNIKAKMGGLRHVMREYFTGVPAEIKISSPFPQSTCLHCHAEAASFLKTEQHVDPPEIKEGIFSGKISCFLCHDPPHPRKKP